MSYVRPHSLPEALAVLQRDDRRVVCGGSDAYAEAGMVPSRHDWLDISGIAALRGITMDEEMIVIGAATPWRDIAAHEGLPALLRQAARLVGSSQIQAVATIGGNLCNAAPAADGVPPLLALDARVELTSRDHRREVPLADFILGRRRTALRRGELLTAVRFERCGASDRSAFHKFGNRQGMAIAVVSAAVRLRWSDDGTVAGAAVAVGSASEAPVRLRALEDALAGRTVDGLESACADAPMPELRPIDDLRGSAELRRHLARVLLARACLQSVKETADVQHRP